MTNQELDTCIKRSEISLTWKENLVYGKSAFVFLFIYKFTVMFWMLKLSNINFNRIDESYALNFILHLLSYLLRILD